MPAAYAAGAVCRPVRLQIENPLSSLGLTPQAMYLPPLRGWRACTPLLANQRHLCDSVAAAETGCFHATQPIAENTQGLPAPNGSLTGKSPVSHNQPE